MSVKDVSHIGHLSLVAGSKKPVSSAPEESKLEPEDKVSVEKSSEVAEAIVNAQVSASSDREKVVEALATAVRQGTYQPNPQRIAEEILEDAKLIAKLQAMLSK